MTKQTKKQVVNYFLTMENNTAGHIAEVFGITPSAVDVIIDEALADGTINAAGNDAELKRRLTAQGLSPLEQKGYFY